MTSIHQKIATVELQLYKAVTTLIKTREAGQCDYEAEKVCCDLEYNRLGLVKARNAIRKYGEQPCVDAFKDHLRGNGASTIGNGKANVGDALIAGGQYLLTGNATYFNIAVSF